MNQPNQAEVQLSILQKKRKGDGTWNMKATQPGQVHFVMETAGSPIRWNTLRALRVLKYFEIKN